MATNPQTLLDQAACFACYGASTTELLTLALLDTISQGGSGPGSCANLEGVASPLNVVTPDFVGQVYVQADGTIWQAGTLLANSWTVICDSNGVGLIWGPLPATIPALSGGADAMQAAVTTFSNVLYTDFSFGNPVTIVGACDWDNSANLTSIEMRNLTSVGAGVNGFGCGAIVSVSLPLLATIGGDFNINTCILLTSVDLTSLVSVGLVQMSVCTALPSLSMPALTTCTGDFSVAVCPLLISFSAPLWVPTDGTTITFNGDALDIPSVELILRRCVLAGVITCAIDLSGGTNAGTASLSAQGQADVATLGAQVTMNP